MRGNHGTARRNDGLNVEITGLPEGVTDCE